MLPLYPWGVGGALCSQREIFSYHHRPYPVCLACFTPVPPPLGISSPKPFPILRDRKLPAPTGSALHASCCSHLPCTYFPSSRIGGDISSPLWSPWHPPHCSEIIHLYSSTITFSVRRERREHSHLKLKSLARIFPPQVNPPVVPVVGLNFTSRMKWSVFVQALPHKGRFAGGDHVMGELRLWLWRQEKLLRMWG